MPVVSFDLDGVLIQNPFAKGVGPRIREHIRKTSSLSSLEPAEADLRVNEAVRRAWGARMAARDFVRAYDWDEIYTEVSLALGGTPVPPVADIVAACCGEEGMIALLPGADEGLVALRRAGFRLVAATNGYHAYQLPVLEALGIAACFDEVLTPERVGYAKPDPRFFAGVAGLVAHVGDTLVHDVLGANLAGIEAVWLKAQLPDVLLPLSPIQRTVDPHFVPLLKQSLAETLYVEYHPEATVQSCTPRAVVVDVAEVLEALEGSAELEARS